MTLEQFLELLEKSVIAANENVAIATAASSKAERELAAFIAIYRPQPDQD